MSMMTTPLPVHADVRIFKASDNEKIDLFIETSFDDSNITSHKNCGKCKQPKTPKRHKCTAVMIVSPEKKKVTIAEKRLQKKRKLSDAVADSIEYSNVIILPNRIIQPFKVVIEVEAEVDPRNIYKTKHNKTKIAVEERKIRMIEKRDQFIMKRMNNVTKGITKRSLTDSPSSFSITSMESDIITLLTEEDPIIPINFIEDVVAIVLKKDIIDDYCVISDLEDESLYGSFQFDFCDVNDPISNFNDNMFNV